MSKTKAKYKWKVDEVPSGPYSSFQHRSWPSAFYQDEQQSSCADIQCKDDYTPQRAKSGQHAPLIIRICDHSVSPFKWRTMKTQHMTLVEVKTALAAFIEAHPEVMPKEFCQAENTAM